MGRVWKFSDDINTDEIIPARFNITIDPKELAKNVFCEVRPEFPKQVKDGDVVIGGENFGCGSSREHAPIAIKGAGVACVIAKSYARIFYRNAINIGLPLLEIDTDDIEDGKEIEVNVQTGTITYGGKTLQAKPSRQQADKRLSTKCFCLVVSFQTSLKSFGFSKQNTNTLFCPMLK